MILIVTQGDLNFLRKYRLTIGEPGALFPLIELWVAGGYYIPVLPPLDRCEWPTPSPSRGEAEWAAPA